MVWGVFVWEGTGSEGVTGVLQLMNRWMCL